MADPMPTERERHGAACTKPLSLEWMIECFGEPFPPEVVALLFDRDSDDWTMGEVRAEVRRMGEQRLQERQEAAHGR